MLDNPLFTPKARSAPVSAGLVALFVGAHPGLAAVPTDDLRVNTQTSGAQNAPKVAVSADGHSVIVWQSGSGDIRMRLYAADGTPAGDEFSASGTSSDTMIEPAVAVDAAGDFAVVWVDRAPSGGDRIVARRFDVNGEPLGDVFDVSTSAVENKYPRIAMDDDGDFVVSWLTFDTPSPSIAARRFDAEGTPQGDVFQVSGARALAYPPAIAMDGDGDFVIAWGGLDTLPGYNAYGVFMRRYSKAGTALGTAKRVNLSSYRLEWLPGVAMAADGSFSILWARTIGVGATRLFVQRYSASGNRRGVPIAVTDNSLSGLSVQPAIAAQPNGDFMVTWNVTGMLPETETIMGRKYSAIGWPQGKSFQINSWATGEFREPAVAMDINGGFMATWTASDSESDGSDIRARRVQAGDPVCIVDTVGFTDRYGYRGNQPSYVLLEAPRNSITTFEVARMGNGCGGASLTAYTVGDTATPGIDYVETAQALSWNDGKTGGKTIQVQTLDSTTPGTPQFYVRFSDVLNLNVATEGLVSIVSPKSQ